MNTDIVYGNKPIYAYVHIGIRRSVAFPLYQRRQRIQGHLHDQFKIECYSEEEVSWYQQLCARMKHWLVLLYIDYAWMTEEGYLDRIDGGGNLEFTPDTTTVREHYDGKEFGEKTVREIYVDKSF